jgi:hypothetical protein
VFGKAATFTEDEIYTTISQDPEYAKLSLNYADKKIPWYDVNYARSAISEVLCQISTRVFTHINEQNAKSNIPPSIRPDIDSWEEQIDQICWHSSYHAEKVIIWQYNRHVISSIFGTNKPLKVLQGGQKQLLDALHLLTLQAMKRALPHFFQLLFCLEKVQYVGESVIKQSDQVFKLQHFSCTTQKVYEHYIDRFVPTDAEGACFSCQSCCSIL